MIRENQKYFNGLQVILDLGSILVSFAIAYYIRFFIMPNGIDHITFSKSLIYVLITLPIYFMCYSWFDLYSSKRTKRFSYEATCIIGGNIIGILSLVLILYLAKETHFSRITILCFGMINTCFSIMCRGCIRFVLRRFRKNGFNLRHCLIIGTTPTAHELIKKLNSHSFWGYSIIGVVSTDDRTDEYFYSHPIIGTVSELPKIFERYHVDIAIVATEENSANQLGFIITNCEKAGVKTNIIPYYHKYVPAKPYVDDLDGLPIIDTRHLPLDNLFKAFLKRCFDIIFSSVILILLSPFLLFIALMVKCTSKGPIFFKQERVGLDRKPFYMYKFRSMRMQTDEEEKVRWTTKNDPRKTWWGNFMRKTSIDELPQFYNVLKGDMSVIGPRPERPYFVDKFKEEIPRYMIKHQVRPGITGWAQVNGYRGDTSIEGRIEHDLYYIENWTFALDLKIIILTLVSGFVNKNAY